MSLGPTFQIATAAMSLGHVLLAATEVGVCYVGLGASENVLRNDLYSKFRFGRDSGHQPNAERWLSLVCERVERPTSAADTPPLDLRGTAFQRAVWERLQAIPLGETRAYQAIAEDLGRPDATRAIAGACARNPVGILVPCHRVVRANGEPGGYHWGSAIKRALLAREGAIPNQSSEASSC